MTLLIADESARMRRSIGRALRHANITGLVEAASEAEVRAWLDAHEVDFVIVGERLGGVGGPDLAARLRREGALKHAPVLLVTRRAMPDDVLEAVEAGVDAYIVAPFSADLLVARVRQALRGAARRRALETSSLRRR